MDETYYCPKDPSRSVFDGMWRWWLGLVILMLFLWALESIRRWNRRGRIDNKVLSSSALFAILRPVFSPLLRCTALPVGSPSSWRQMGAPPSTANRVGAPDQGRI
jgi:hypothetical protein